MSSRTDQLQRFGSIFAFRGSRRTSPAKTLQHTRSTGSKCRATRHQSPYSIQNDFFYSHPFPWDDNISPLSACLFPPANLSFHCRKPQSLLIVSLNGVLFSILNPDCLLCPGTPFVLRRKASLLLVSELGLDRYFSPKPTLSSLLTN